MSSDDYALAKIRKPVASRRHMTAGPEGYEGGAFYFEVRAGWETRILRDDNNVTTVLSLLHLQEALRDGTILTVFIPGDAVIGRDRARDLCRVTGYGKTVFFELSQDD